jgi:hypothetical protein
MALGSSEINDLQGTVDLNFAGPSAVESGVAQNLATALQDAAAAGMWNMIWRVRKS